MTLSVVHIELYRPRHLILNIQNKKKERKTYTYNCFKRTDEVWQFCGENNLHDCTIIQLQTEFIHGVINCFLPSRSEFSFCLSRSRRKRICRSKVLRTILWKTAAGARESVLIVCDLTSSFERPFATSSFTAAFRKSYQSSPVRWCQVFNRIPW